VLLTGAALGLSGAPHAPAAPAGLEFLQGLALTGNGQSNVDSSTNNNVVAHGNQQLSGLNISNSPVLTTGGLDTNQSINVNK